jgi:hypothetical protein
MLSRTFQCEDCGSVEGYRSRPRNFLEKHILPLMGLRPVRCADCFRRYYRPSFVVVRERTEAHPPAQRAAA